MDLGRISYDQFSKDVVEFLKISKDINDNWQLFDGEQMYLVKKLRKNVCLNDEFSDFEECDELRDLASVGPDMLDHLLFEFHVIYSISYQVPLLYFNIHRPGNK